METALQPMSNREDDLIRRIRRRIPSAAGGALRVGIGDDAAVISPARGHEWVISTDQFLENVHFQVDVHPPDAIGYKALARATSDLGAMGSTPRLFFLSLALPAKRTGRWLDSMLTGMRRAALRFGLRLAGGDTAQSAAIAFNLTVFGDMPSGCAVLRSGAQPGDAVFVSGRLGAAQLGLELVLRGAYRQARWRKLAAPTVLPRAGDRSRRLARATAYGVSHDGPFGWPLHRFGAAVQCQRRGRPDRVTGHSHGCGPKTTEKPGDRSPNPGVTRWRRLRFALHRAEAARTAHSGFARPDANHPHRGNRARAGRRTCRSQGKSEASRGQRLGPLSPRHLRAAPPAFRSLRNWVRTPRFSWVFTGAEKARRCSVVIPSEAEESAVSPPFLSFMVPTRTLPRVSPCVREQRDSRTAQRSPPVR